jgi:predicted DNA-binding protein (MmcQ/YjbR family)
MSRALRRTVDRLRKFALGMPGAFEDFPWGERVAKVGKKVFVFMAREPDPKTGFTFSVKLPQSAHQALAYPFAQPCAYGLGKSGWVTVRLAPDDRTPPELLIEWVEESYRAVAPRKLVAQLDASE